MLYRWFVGLAIDSDVWNHASFTRNRERLFEHDAVKCLFGGILGWPISWPALGRAFHCRRHPDSRVGGSKSNPDVDFKGTKRSNDTHVCMTDPDAMNVTKSKRDVPSLLIPF